MTAATRTLTGSAMLGFCTASFALVTVAVPVRIPTVPVAMGRLTEVKAGVSAATPAKDPDSTPDPAAT